MWFLQGADMTKNEIQMVLEDYLIREMPEGTIIGNPKWWAEKLANVLAKQQSKLDVNVFPDGMPLYARPD